MPTNTLSLCSGLVTDDMCQVQSNTLSKLKRFCGTSCKFQTETAREKENEADGKECVEERARQRDRELPQQLSMGTRSWSWKRAKAATTKRGYNFRLPSAAHVCAEACVCVFVCVWVCAGKVPSLVMLLLLWYCLLIELMYTISKQSFLTGKPKLARGREREDEEERR